MQTVSDFQDSLQKISLPYNLALSMINSREEYIRLQREQMLAGLRSDGRPIFRLSTGKDEYSPSYAKYKGKKKPIDLRDKGDFQSEIFLVSEDAQTFTVDSADAKSAKLQDDYGEAIFTLDEENQIKFAPVAQQALIDLVTQDLS